MILFSIFLLMFMVANYIPVYMRACTCIHTHIHTYTHTHIHIQKLWLSAWEHRLTDKWYGLIHTYKPLCQPMNSFFFFIANFRHFDTFKIIKDFWLFVHYIINLTHTFQIIKPQAGSRSRLYQLEYQSLWPLLPEKIREISEGWPRADITVRAICN